MGKIISYDYTIIGGKKYPLIVHNNIDYNINTAIDAINVLNHNYWDALHRSGYKKINRYTDSIVDRITISMERLKSLSNIEYYINHPFQPTIKYIKFHP